MNEATIGSSAYVRSAKRRADAPKVANTKFHVSTCDATFGTNAPHIRCMTGKLKRERCCLHTAGPQPCLPGAIRLLQRNLGLTKTEEKVCRIFVCRVTRRICTQGGACCDEIAALRMNARNLKVNGGWWRVGKLKDLLEVGKCRCVPLKGEICRCALVIEKILRWS
jgi:hypothetical protein